MYSRNDLHLNSEPVESFLADSITIKNKNLKSDYENILVFSKSIAELYCYKQSSFADFTNFVQDVEPSDIFLLILLNFFTRTFSLR